MLTSECSLVDSSLLAYTKSSLQSFQGAKPLQDMACILLKWSPGRIFRAKQKMQNHHPCGPSQDSWMLLLCTCYPTWQSPEQRRPRSGICWQAVQAMIAYITLMHQHEIFSRPDIQPCPHWQYIHIQIKQSICSSSMPILWQSCRMCFPVSTTCNHKCFFSYRVIGLALQSHPGATGCTQVHVHNLMHTILASHHTAVGRYVS